jgi:protein-S-isoprenylcysteine O-methyltransferase Ste14
VDPWPAFWTLDREYAPLFQYAGSGMIVLGLAAVVALIGFLGVRRSFGLDVNGLWTSGPCGLTRNPQIVVGSMIILGTTLCRPSWYAAGWVLLYLAMAQIMVLTEEEHLRAVFGESPAGYCRRVQRYVCLRRKRDCADA